MKDLKDKRIIITGATGGIGNSLVKKFSEIAEEWWDPTGKFKPLHKFNPIRISYIKNNIILKYKK